MKIPVICKCGGEKCCKCFGGEPQIISSGTGKIDGHVCFCPCHSPKVGLGDGVAHKTFCDPGCQPEIGCKEEIEKPQPKTHPDNCLCLLCISPEKEKRG